MTKLTIFILCHNRPAYAKLAIESVLHQTNKEFRLVISDNSDNDEMQQLAKTEFPTLEYRRRAPSLPAINHFNKNISEADTEFLCLFHDDDLMEQGYVEAMLKMTELNPNAVAYACNAAIIDDKNVPHDESFESREPYVKIENPRVLAGRYFSRYPNGFAPFPAYVYRTSIVKDLPLDPQSGGKYSDLTWLLELSKKGLIIWCADKLIRYRIHAGNDGGFESAKDRLKLFGYLKKNKSFVGQNIVNDYRFFLYKKLSKEWISRRKYPARYEHCFRNNLRWYRARRLFRSETYAYFCHKIGKLFS